VAEPVTAPSVGPGDLAATKPTARGLLALFLARVLRDPIRSGRLRNTAWPYGLGMVVAAAYLLYAVAAGVVIFSSRIREGAELTVSSTSAASLPRGYVWLLILLVLVALALFQTAALHAVWWLRLVGLAASMVVITTWGVRYTSISGGLIEAVLSVVAILALIAFALVRGRRPFAWWEFPVVLLLLSAPVALGVALVNRTARPLGYDFVSVYLQSTMTSLGPLAMPAAVAAGLSVAEITVSGTLWATRLTMTYLARRLAYVVLGSLLVLRLGQATWQLTTWDWVRQGWNVFGTWLIFAAVLALLSAVVLRLGGRGPLTVSLLPERMASMALPLGLALVGIAFLAVVVLGVFGVAASLAPAQIGAQSDQWLSGLTSITGPNIFRILLALALIALALRVARRGKPATGVLLVCVAVMLLARVARWATNGILNAGVGADALNLIATLVLVVAVTVTAVRRRLTPERAIGFSGALVLSALLAYHDFVSDPLGALLGFSGAALVLFGLTWGLFTDSGYANDGSRKYPVPTRVLFVLANAVLAITILAFTSLVRDPTATINLDDFAALGDQVLGTALLAATFVAVLTAVRDERPID
jgi:hypothetical protein